MSDRRDFLKYLAASPLVFGLPGLAEALTQAATRRVVPPAHWGYMATGVDGEAKLRANQQAYSRYQLRVRRFVDVSKIDLAMTILGQTFASPVIICPAGSQRAFHAEGELAVARAAQARKQLQILSTQSSTPIEDVAKARAPDSRHRTAPGDGRLRHARGGRHHREITHRHASPIVTGPVTVTIHPLQNLQRG